MATMKDISRLTGLGLATISSYFNGGNVREKNRIAIENAVEELGFEINEIARGLKSKKTRTIGIVIPELSNIFCTGILRVVEDILRNRGYATMVCDCRTNSEFEKNAVDFLVRKMVDGIINIPVTTDGSHLKSAIDKDKPVVLVDRKIAGVECDTVLVDNVGAAREAVRLLISMGHRKIGFIAGPNSVFTAGERLQGYLEALKEAGIKVDKSLIGDGDYTIEGGTRCMEKLLSNKEMTAVFVTNYDMTLGAVIAINHAGVKIPEQLAFIGFDSLEFAKAVTPTLSVVTQPLKEIGIETAKLMLKRLEGIDFEPRTVILKTQYIAGKSV